MDHFDDNTALVLHHRAQEPCPLREWVVPEGIDEEQKEKLRRIGQVWIIERQFRRCGGRPVPLRQPMLTLYSRTGRRGRKMEEDVPNYFPRA